MPMSTIVTAPSVCNGPLALVDSVIVYHRKNLLIRVKLTLKDTRERDEPCYRNVVKGH